MPPKLPQILPDHPLYIEAMEAQKQYQQAQAEGQPQENVQRLRVLAESLFQALTDYHLRAVGITSEKAN